MGRDLLHRNKERTSLTKGARECDPGSDKPTQGGNTRILDFRQDEERHWIAGLSCGHTQHLRHQPPWQNRDWVLDPQQRSAMIGQPFACGWCAAEPDSTAQATLANDTDSDTHKER